MQIRIGTRSSKLAMTQAMMVRNALLRQYPELAEADIELAPMKTTGDKIKEKPLAEMGGKGLFTKELEEALLDGQIDMAVHSMKDMPTELPEGLMISAILPREDARDAFISRSAITLKELPEGAKVGTSSLRRASQALAARPDLVVVPFRGNVPTRLRKLEEGQVEATFLAAAGLLRMEMGEHITSVIEPEVMLPAVGQGAIGIETREDNELIRELLFPLSHDHTEACVYAEREVLRMLDGNCRTPIAAYAEITEHTLHLRALVASLDGQDIYRAEVSGPDSDAVLLGSQAGDKLLSDAGNGFLSRFGSC